jgi:hypothetical protein
MRRFHRGGRHSLLCIRTYLIVVTVRVLAHARGGVWLSTVLFLASQLAKKARMKRFFECSSKEFGTLCSLEERYR